jgi:hypothetical protein
MPWEVIIPPEHEPLYRALAGLGVSELQILKAVSVLTEPPEALSLPAPERLEIPDQLIDEMVGFDGDMAARMLRVSQGKPDPTATWLGLSRAERKRAKRR